MYVCIYLFIFIFIIYLQSPAAILSSDPPQPIDLLSACLPIYPYISILYLDSKPHTVCA